MARKIICFFIICLIFALCALVPNLYAGDGCEKYQENLCKAQQKIVDCFMDNEIDSMQRHLEDFLFNCHLLNIRCSHQGLISTPIDDFTALGSDFCLTLYKAGFVLFCKEFDLNPVIFVRGKTFQK